MHDAQALTTSSENSVFFTCTVQKTALNETHMFELMKLGAFAGMLVKSAHKCFFISGFTE